MTHGQRVLLVEGLAETEEVLKTVLEPRGLEVDRIRAHRPQRSAAPRPPHLVILHEDDSAAARPWEVEQWKDVPRVIIGSIHLPAGERQTSEGPATDAARTRYLSHPFHYRDLIQAVETLLANKAGQGSRVKGQGLDEDERRG